MMEENQFKTQHITELEEIRMAVEHIQQELKKVIIGQQNMIDLMLIGLFSGGHLLLEGVPGVAKTLIAKLLAKSISTQFSRIQFTPDFMPTDVLGTSVFNQKTVEFVFRKGPIFSNIILIDEINRAPAKTQAALLEVMEELKVTMDGETYPMVFPFMVIATQNPIEQEGTYKLPEAQLDRFLFRIKINYPSLEEEKQILYLYKNDFNNRTQDKVDAILSIEQLKACRAIVENIYIKDDLLDYIAALVYQTRNHPDLYLGASPRASLGIMKASKAKAAISGRNFVTPDDIHFVANAVLNHRIILSPDKELEGYDTESVIQSIISKLEVPR